MAEPQRCGLCGRADGKRRTIELGNGRIVQTLPKCDQCQSEYLVKRPKVKEI